MSTSSGTVRRPIPSDATLVWLASERAAPLFRTLDRTKAFGPLAVLLAVLPAILAVFADTITPVDAAWGLRALDVLGADMPPEASRIVDEICPSPMVRPAALWLTAALMRLVDPSTPASISIASLLGGVSLIAALWLLAKGLSGRRFAFWAVVLAAFHPTLTSLLHFPVPVTVALALGMLALWGHSNLEGRPLRVWLSAAAVAISTAVALWLVGPAAFAVPAIIAADALLAYIMARRTPAAPKQGGRNLTTPAEVAGRRLATALAGIVMWGIAESALPSSTWTISDRSVSTDQEELAELDVIGDVPIIGPLWGLAAIGAGRLLRVLGRRTTRGTRPAPRLLLPWLVLGAGLLIWTADLSASHFDPANSYLLAMSALPMLASAAYGIEEAARRTVSGAWVLLAVSLPLAVRLGSLMASVSSDGPMAWLSLALAASVIAWLVAKVLPAVVPMPGLRRGVLMVAILAVIAVNSGDGLALLFRGSDSDEPYRDLRMLLAMEEPVDAIVLLTDAPVAPELVYVLRSSKPHALMEIAPTWDEASIRLDRKLQKTPRRIMAAVWGLPDTTGAAAAEELRPVGDPLLCEGRELLLYLDDGMSDPPMITSSRLQ